MTAIAAIETKGISLVVTDKLGTIGDTNANNMRKVFYGENYIIGFSGVITSSFYDFIETNIGAIASNNQTPEDIIKYIKNYLASNEPKYVKQVSCICIKNGIMAYAKYSLDGFVLTQKNTFVGIGSGGNELATGLSVAFNGQDISLLTPEEIKEKAQSVMEYVSKMKSGVGKDIQIYIQKENNDFYVYNDEEGPKITTAEFSDDIPENRKKISAIVASSALCSDGYELSPLLLTKISKEINASPALMRLIPIGSKYHNENGKDEVVGEWVEAKTINLKDVTLLKARGYIGIDTFVSKNLSTSISCTPTEIALRKGKNGQYIKSVIDAELNDISITLNPLDKFCSILEASGEMMGECTEDDVFVSSFTVKFNNSDFDNLLNNDMNTEAIQTDLQETAVPEVEQTAKCANETPVDEVITEEVGDILPTPTPPVDIPPKEAQQPAENSLEVENTQLKEQIKEYDALVDQFLQQNKKLVEDNKTYDKILNTPQVLEEILKSHKSSK
jgi:ATP-dependent protease HslVU (ClpYQ) peptidase subunit